MDAARLTAALKDEARRLGFDLVGACPAAAPPRIECFRRWLEAGYAGQMRYLADRRAAYEHPNGVLEGAQSLVMLGLAYRTVEPHTPGDGEGRVSRYAWGTDYHDLVHERLRLLAQHHIRLTPHAKVRGVVDTAPLLEREFAQMAGLGWIGKNTLLLNRRLGSWVFLAAFLTTERLQYDRPEPEGHCGSCRACLDACPTGALVDAHCLDARKCISYLTIELGTSIPRQLRQPAGEWLFGCDVCQEVCPWNHRTPIAAVQALHPLPGMNPVELEWLFGLSEAAYRARFRGTPLWRAKRAGLLRNSAIVLGNRPHEAAISGLVQGLKDAEPIVRGACAWALGRYPVERARTALGERLSVEADREVRGEIESALGDSGES
jgi:epoxyqueuosine reductase